MMRFLLFSLLVIGLATLAEAGTLTATWDPLNANPNSGTLQSYRLYRKLAADATFPASPTATIPAPATTYQDTAVTDGIQYCYVLTAVYQGGESPPSNQACGASFAVPTNPPVSLRITFP